ncbi:MAG TPA: response regulator transcription factor [Candidatus Micrarchaeaceae archaeon]|nr:response regulator transcription factor [Candidatus Micrarchaeaceae archaeon]
MTKGGFELIRVGIVDDHPVFRLGLRATFERQRDFKVVWDLGSPTRLLETIADSPTDVLLMDLDLGLGPKQDGLTATRAIRNVHPEIRVVIITAALDEASIAASRAAGASGYLAKDLSATEMVAAVRTLTAYGPIRKIFGGRYAASATSGGTTWSAIRGLTRREQEVLAALNRGHTNREIATQFGVSVTTVNKHVQQVLKKLHVRNRSQAVARMHAETVMRAYQEVDARS